MPTIWMTLDFNCLIAGNKQTLKRRGHSNCCRNKMLTFWIHEIVWCCVPYAFFLGIVCTKSTFKPFDLKKIVVVFFHRPFSTLEPHAILGEVVVGPDGFRFLALFRTFVRFLHVKMTDSLFLSFLAVCRFLY